MLVESGERDVNSLLSSWHRVEAYFFSFSQRLFPFLSMDFVSFLCVLKGIWIEIIPFFLFSLNSFSLSCPILVFWKFLFSSENNISYALAWIVSHISVCLFSCRRPIKNKKKQHFSVCITFLHLLFSCYYPCLVLHTDNTG